MIDLKNSIDILKEQYLASNAEILRFDLQYNNFHIFFFYRPKSKERYKELLIFNAYIEEVLISKPLYQHQKENKLITSIPNDLYQYFKKLGTNPDNFFSVIIEKIINNDINYNSSSIQEVANNHTLFIQNFRNYEADKPYFWRFYSARMSSLIEKKLIFYGATKEEIEYLKRNNITAQFTHDPRKEKELIISQK